MSRPLRVEFPGALWHVTSRGVEQRAIYLDDGDRRHFLELMAEVIESYRWRLDAYVLMGNHYHLLVQTPEPTLSRGMQKLGGDYAEAFNLRHERVGHLFQGRFKSHLVESETYLLQVARYIVLNPVRAGMVRTAGEWPWSSYAATAGLAPAPAWLDISGIMDAFQPIDRETACARYREFVAEGVNQTASPWENLAARSFLGSRQFLREMEEKVRQLETCPEHLFEQRRYRLARIDQVRACVESEIGPVDRPSENVAAARQAFALVARAESLTTLADIGNILGVGLSGVRYLIRRAERKRVRDPEFSALVEAVRRRLDHCKLQM